MFNVLCILTLLLATVSAIFVPRASPPEGWLTNVLEDYEGYHIRYLALDCQFQHKKPFFEACCHPLLANQTLATARGPQCIPSPAAMSSASAVEPTSTVTAPGDGDDGDDGDCDDDGSESSATVTSTTQSPPTTTTPTPVATQPQSPPPSQPTASSTPEPEPTTTKPKTTTTKSKTTTASPIPSSTPSSDSGSIITGGFGTFFFQNGVAGACGAVNPDSALIAAIDVARYGDTGKRSPLCGRKLKITNIANGKSVVVVVADACPTCDNANSVDLSVGAFTEIAEESTGLIDIDWIEL